MGILTSLSLRRPERRALSGEPWVVQLLGRGSQTSSGVWVNPDTALRYTAVLAAVRIISESIAMLPMNIYRRLPKGGKEIATTHPLFATLHMPNDWQTGFEWREMMTAHVLLRGNAYSEIDWNNDGSIAALIPRHPDRIKPFKRDDGTVWYEYRPINGPVRIIAQDEMFHLRGLSTDGVMGMSPISLAREAVGLGMATEEYQARFFSNDATPPIAFTHPNTLTEEAARRLKQSIQEMYSGLPNAHRPFVAEEGMKVTQIGLSNRDAQFLELRKFQISEIARLFRVPPHMLADMTGQNYSTVEQESQEFVKFTLWPWIERWRHTVHRDLMSAKGRSAYFVGFQTRELLLGDMQSRTGYYNGGRQWGWLSADEVREMEGLNPRTDPGGETFLEPLNMVEQGNAGPKQLPADPKTGPPVKPTTPPPAPEPENDENKRQLEAHRKALRDLVEEKSGRIVAKEIKALRRITEKHSGPDFVREAERFYEQFAEAPSEHIRESRRLLANLLKDSDDVSKLLDGWQTRVGSLADVLYAAAIKSVED